MNNEELTPFIVKELSRHRERQEIVRQICEKSGLGWREAEDLIHEVELQNKGKIAARQGPLLILLSVGSLVLGIGLLAYNMELIAAIFRADLMNQILGLRSGYYQLASLVTGIGMIMGGFIGIWNTLLSFFPD